MKVLHFDCFSGISGDMTLGALLDAGVEEDRIRQGIASLKLPIGLEIAKIRKGGFASTYVVVESPEEDKHRFLPEIEEIIERGDFGNQEKVLAHKVFRKLAEAEAAAHGQLIERVHFHEVGALDSIADIVGASIGLVALKIDHFSSRAVPTGTGMVKCAHGLMPVPTPATAALLKGVPLAATTIKAELTTPTGAAILTSVVNEWTDAVAMTVETIGQGAGRRELLEQPNLLRVFIGHTSIPTRKDQVWLLETNLDDVPAEILGYCVERLMAAGSLDVFLVPIQMKKHRPGVVFSVLCGLDLADALEQILFAETGTLGIRRSLVSRSKMNRKSCKVVTAWGPVQGKLGWLDGSKPAFSPEYEDCARVARQHGLPLREVYEAVQRAYESAGAIPEQKTES